jgi:hypothetical protein
MPRTPTRSVDARALTTSRTAVFVPLSGTPHRRDVDARTLPLGPLDAFVLSQVDGRSSVEEIAAAASLSPEEVHRILHVLAHKGAIDFDEPNESCSRLRTPIAWQSSRE